MIIYVYILSLILLFSIRILPHKIFNEEYCSSKNTLWVKGLFTLLIFISHFTQYVPCDSFLDRQYFAVKSCLGQLVVAPFLFLSGYGVYSSIQNKQDYIKEFPARRIWKTAFQFHVALFLFLILGIIRGEHFTFCQLGQAFFSWKGIGNSDWFVFIILVLYAFVYFSFLVFKEKDAVALISLFLLSCCLVIFLRYTKRDEYWWYDTILAFPAGMIFARYQDKINSIVLKTTWSWIFALFVLLVGFLLLYHSRKRIIAREMLAALFPIIILIGSAKFTIKSPVLDYFGRHLFSFFILQRLPMIALKDTSIEGNKYIFLAEAFLLTFVLSWTFDKTVPVLWNVVQKNIENKTKEKQKNNNLK